MNLQKKLRDFFTLSRKANGGFTLVELIVVIAIIAILAGVAVPAYNGYVIKARKSADETLLKAVNSAFGAACIKVASRDLADYEPDELQVPLTDEKTVDMDEVTADYKDAFKEFFDVGENAAFQYYNSVRFNGDLFVGYEGFAYRDGNNNNWYYSQGAMDAYKGSMFDAIGITQLMGTVDGLVGGLGDNTTSINSLKNSPEFMAFLEAKGVNVNNNADVAAALATYTAKSVSGVSADALYDTIAKATDAEGNWNYTKALNDVSALLYGSTSNDFANKAASAAILYSLGTSFQASDAGFDAIMNGKLNLEDLDASKVTNGVQFNDYMSSISSEYFDSYIKNDAKKDVEALLGAFDVVNENYDLIDEYRKENNGYNNNSINDAINSILGN